MPRYGPGSPCPYIDPAPRPPAHRAAISGQTSAGSGIEDGPTRSPALAATRYCGMHRLSLSPPPEQWRRNQLSVYLVHSRGENFAFSDINLLQLQKG